MKVPVSSLIPIKNEAANLPRGLESVSRADEIFVVDSLSTDGSQRIAESYGATVVQFIFNGSEQITEREILFWRNQWADLL